ncbi:MAG TPA: choice-of-anchor V domain-containing protein [Bryobacteraceae bacterium]|nr:choice-of-anchor V domain-containing protein [Bryobacteraceae bacterium]
MRRHLLLCLFAAAPIILLAFAGINPAGYTGDPADGGNTCASCHNTYGPANSDLQGSLAIMAADYLPGTAQTIRVTVTHPTAVRWGFQLTARSINNPAVAAGTFVATSDTAVVCPSNTAAPCGGPPEFAEDTLAPSTGPVGSYEFDVTWNPPTSEVGRIVFYGAAVAADGNGSPTNDRVYTASTTISLSAKTSCSLSQRPVIRTAVNGASFQPAFSPGSMLTIFGSGFQASGHTRTAGPGDYVGNSFPTVLSCIGVLVNGKAAPVTYVDPGQINIQVPNIAPSGPVTLVVAGNAGGANELDSDVATLSNIQPYAPAFFVFANTTSIAAQFANSATPVADPSIVPGGHAAKPGDVVTLYGAGFGATNPAVDAGALASGIATITTPVTVTIGGVTLPPSDVLYAGLSPGSISGLYQFNVRIPTSAPNGNVPVSIQAGGYSTQPGATIPVQQ